MQKSTIKFFDLVTDLENIWKNKTNGSTEEEEFLGLISLVSESEFLLMRRDIIKVFKIGELEPFSGECYDEDDVEVGDISHAVQMTTIRLFPQSTPMDKPLSFDDRINWCREIVAAIDEAVQG